jgi:hypothetical protein
MCCSITHKRIRCDNFIGVAELELAIALYVANHNDESQVLHPGLPAPGHPREGYRAEAALATASRQSGRSGRVRRFEISF